MRLTQLLRPKGLGYPAGRQPGFDPTHPMSIGLVRGYGFSGIANSGGNFRSLLTGKSGTIAGSPSYSLNGIIGPGFITTGASDVSTFSGQHTGGNSAGTVAAIIATPSGLSGSSGFAVVFWSSTTSGTGTAFFFENNTMDIELEGGSGRINSGVALLPNVPYFVAASIGAPNVNFVFRRLDNGAIQTVSVAGSNSVSGSDDGTYQIGNAPVFSQPFGGKISAVMYTPRYFSMSSLVQFAYDPWSFWYPYNDIWQFATPSGGAAITLVGAGMTMASGAFAKAVIEPFTGAGATSTAGSFANTIINPFASAGATSAAGSFTDALIDFLTGAGATSAAGSFAFGSSQNVNLSGAGLTSGAGSFVEVLADALAGAGMTSGVGSLAVQIAKALSGAGLTSGAGSFTISAGNNVTVNLAGAGLTSAGGNFARAIAEPFAGVGVLSGAGSFSVGLSGSAALPGIGVLSGAGKFAFPISSVNIIAQAAPLPTWSIRPTLASAGISSGAGSILASAGFLAVALPGAAMLSRAGIILVTVTHILPAGQAMLVSVEQRIALVPVDRGPMLVLPTLVLR